MPGIPRSQACAQCKRRSIKCSQDWPVCAQCKRSKLACPGPSSLFKFVSHDGRHAKHNANLSQDGKSSPKSPENDKKVDTSQISKRTQGTGSSYRDSLIVIPSSFRHVLPPQMPATIADQVAGRLSFHLNSTFERRMMTDLMYLPYIPKHLNQNSSLLHSVDFLCSIWARHRRKELIPEFIKMPMYGKAIRSLSETLQSDQAFTMETMASIVILQKTEDLFNPDPNHFQHEHGLSMMMSRVGPPVTEDTFHSSIVGELYALLIPFWIATGWKEIPSQALWNGAVTGFLGANPHDQPLQAWLEQVMNDTNQVCSQLAKVTQLKETLETSAGNHEALSITPQITTLYDEIGRLGDEMCNMLIDQIVEDIGKVKIEDEETNRPLLMGLPGQAPVFLVTMRLHILRQRYEWSLINSLPNELALGIELTAFCDTVRAIIPHLRIGRVFADDPLPLDANIDELASSAGKTHMLNVYAEWDKAKQLLSKKREISRPGSVGD